MQSYGPCRRRARRANKARLDCHRGHYNFAARNSKISPFCFSRSLFLSLSLSLSPSRLPLMLPGSSSNLWPPAPPGPESPQVAKLELLASAICQPILCCFSFCLGGSACCLGCKRLLSLGTRLSNCKASKTKPEGHTY